MTAAPFDFEREVQKGFAIAEAQRDAVAHGLVARVRVALDWLDITEPEPEIAGFMRTGLMLLDGGVLTVEQWYVGMIAFFRD